MGLQAVRLQPLAAGFLGFDDVDGAELGYALAPLQQGRGHDAAADAGDLHAGRGPNSAVPSRIMVAPWPTASA